MEEDGRRLLAIRIRTKTNKVVEKLYPVDDVLESIIDPEPFLPIRFTKKLSEGRYRCHQRTTFDHKNLKAKWEALDEGDDREEVFDIEPDTRCIVSLMYSIRKAGLPAGTTRHYRGMADEKMYDLYTREGKPETVHLKKYGDVKCNVFEPDAKFGGLVRAQRQNVDMGVRRRALSLRQNRRARARCQRQHPPRRGDQPGNDRWGETIVEKKEKKTGWKSTTVLKDDGRRTKEVAC